MSTGYLEKPKSAANWRTETKKIRNEMAAHMHDEVCGPMVAVLHDLHWIARSTWATSEIRSRAELAQDTLSTALRAGNMLLSESQAETGAVNLTKTITEIFKAVSIRAGLQISISIPIEIEQLSPHQKNVCLRFVKEAVSNIFKHANATIATIEAKKIDDHFLFRVSDNGCGLLPGITDVNDLSYGMLLQP